MTEEKKRARSPNKTMEQMLQAKLDAVIRRRLTAQNRATAAQIEERDLRAQSDKLRRAIDALDALAGDGGETSP